MKLLNFVLGVFVFVIFLFKHTPEINCKMNQNLMYQRT